MKLEQVKEGGGVRWGVGGGLMGRCVAGWVVNR